MLRDPFTDKGQADNLAAGEKRFSLSKEKKEKILNQISSYLSRRREIAFAYAHGSFLEQLPCRDIDIAIYYDDKLTEKKQLDLSIGLSATLSRKLRLPVDIHALNQSPPGFQYYVTRGLLVVPGDAQQRNDFVERAWLKYFDYEPILKESLRDLLAP